MEQQPTLPVLEQKKATNIIVAYSAYFRQILDTKIQTNVIAKVKAVIAGKQPAQGLTRHSAELGMLFITREANAGEQQWYYMDKITYKSDRYNRIEELLGNEQWDDPENYALLEYWFGAEKAVYVRHAWKQVRYQMYQQGFTRRSFRSPNDKELYLRNQIDFIIEIIHQSYTFGYDSNYNTVFQHYDLSVTEQIKYAHALGDSNTSLFRLWSAAIDTGNQAVLQQLEDILFNKDEVGKVTRSIIKALLNSEKPEAWVLVEKLLLAAQRQEGLRQTILEALDETSTGALKYMTKVIIDHNLARFSSVVRAVDVWAGLGWESERETTVRSFLEKAYHYLENPEDIPGAMQSDNNADVYMALWAQGVYDVEQTMPYLQQLYETGNSEKRTLALIFANQTENYKIQMPMYYLALDDKELQPLACAINYIYFSVQPQGNDAYYNAWFPDLFSKLNEVYKRSTVKEKTFESYLFSWLKITFDKKNILRGMLHLVAGSQERLNTVLSYFDDMDAAIKRQISYVILPKQAAYNFQVSDENIIELTPFQRNYAFTIIGDRSEYEIGYKALYNTVFDSAEIAIFPDLLKRKAAGFRNQIISLLVKQKEELLMPVLETVLRQGDVEQRLAGLDILLQLRKAKRLPADAINWIAAFKERKNISQKEEILLSQLTTAEKTIDVSQENGFGLFNPRNIQPVVPPQIDPDSFYEQWYAKNEYAFSIPFSRINEAFEDLAKLVEQYKDYEYEVQYWDNTKSKVLLGNQFAKTCSLPEGATDQEVYETYPLPHVWEEWYKKWNLQPRDLFLISLSISSGYGVPDAAMQLMEKQMPVYTKFLSGHNATGSGLGSMIQINAALTWLYPFEQKDEFCIGAATRLFASINNDLLQYRDTNPYRRDDNRGWQTIHLLSIFLTTINLVKLDDKLIQSCWELYHWRQYSGLPEAVKDSIGPLMIFCKAYKAGIIGGDDMYRGLLTTDNMRLLSKKQHHKNDYDYFDAFPFLQPMFERIREHLLNIELKRGDSATPVTELTSGLQVIYGVGRLAAMLAGMGKTTLYKGYIYTYGSKEKNKQESFSSLLKGCHPLPSDTQQLFDEWMDKIKVTETRLVEAAVYAPQWQKFVSSYLGWKGLDTAIWWMHAHTKTDAYQDRSGEAESEIAKYSSVDLQDFKDGAVDKEWFLKAYKEIGKERWSVLYDAAKYISDGNGHRRARIYADVLLGILNLKEVTEKIKSKRDQDYLRIYGLLPLSKSNPAKDVLARYEYLQQFKKESREFGSLKQTSEALAIRVAMENLARNAGYPDPQRLTWAMETKQVQGILAKETRVQYDDVVIGLTIDEEGEADVVAYKENKPLKAIPAKYKKDKKVVELMGFRKTLREQLRRSRRGLEDAMVREDAFLLSEIVNLFEHPIIVKHLEKLAFVIDGKDDKIEAHGFFREGNLVTPDGEAFAIQDKGSLRIAHCTDLHRLGAWVSYQRYAFDQSLQQPFKQIFRELYLPTADELSEKSISRRYAGHQVQPKQTAALLKSRNWKVSYEEGLQKVFHKNGVVAKLFAMADWFSPAEIESPTLETVVFHDLKTYKNVAFTDIPAIIFSEVMRDLDLVVSVAHTGAVDAEASHSSIEMRAALLRETLRLFKIGNVEIIGSHAKIKGTMGEYSVHLGSAVAHKMAAGYLSILPVHSQHRGRLFLPFVDDDPKSAEVISKVLLLARDKQIQDPVILQQLNG